MKPRIHTPISAQTLFDQVLHTSIDWPWKTVRLERSSLLDYQQRPASVNFSVAELYHENSKLFPERVPELTVARLHANEVRWEFVERRAATVRETAHPCPDLHLSERELLSAVARTTEGTLFYAIDLYVVAGEWLVVHEPVTDTLQVVKQLSSGDLGVLQRALRLMATPEEPLHAGSTLFLVGCFSRNDVLFGSRGYRRTLVEAGQVMQALLIQAKRLNMVVQPRYEFIDRDLDAVLEADGIEQGTLVALELRGGEHEQ